MDNIQQLQQTIQEIYIKNINYFQKSHPKLYDRIVDFEKNHQESYYLDFSNNHFELFDKNDNPTYNCDPFYDAQYRAKNIFNAISGISTINTQPRDIKTDLKYDINRFINQYIQLYQNDPQIKNIRFNKFIFIGTLLGVHINDIVKTIDTNTILIVENSLEVFRLSMFLTDYKEVALSNKIFFAIETDELELTNTIINFLNYNNKYNYFIKFEIATQKEIPLLGQITDIISSNSKTIYPYSQFLKAYSNGIKNFISYKKLINLSKSYTILQNKPVLFLAAGPSLKYNIKSIKKNRNNFIIVAVLATLKRLEYEDIVPDIIITIDSDIKLLGFTKVKSKYYKNSTILAGINTHPKVLKKLSKSSHLYLLQTNIEIFENYGVFSGSTVGDIGLKILLQLGANQLYILGIDASLDPKTGATHDDLHNFNQYISLDLNDNQNKDFSQKIYKMDGNLKDTVYTSGQYKLLIDSFNDININPNQIKIYNLSSNGARLNNTYPTNPESLKLQPINKTLILNNLNQNLLNNLKISLTQNEINSFKIETKIASEFFTLNKTNIQNSLIYKLIEKYYDVIQPYYLYILDNYKNISKENLDKIQFHQIKQILKTYKKIVKQMR